MVILQGLASQQQADDVAFVWSDGVPASRYVGFWKESQPNYKDGSCALVSSSCEGRHPIASWWHSCSQAADSLMFKLSLFQGALSKSDLEWSLERCNILRPFICELPACVKGNIAFVAVEFLARLILNLLQVYWKYCLWNNFWMNLHKWYKFPRQIEHFPNQIQQSSMQARRFWNQIEHPSN